MPETPFDHQRPLDALIPELAEANVALPATPVHPRVLEAEADGGHEWIACVWRDPGGARALHEALEPLVEATLLIALSQPSARVETASRRFQRFVLLVFDDLPEASIREASAAFGFQQSAKMPSAATIKPLVAEGRSMGFHIPSTPVSCWSAPIQGPQGELDEKLAEIQTRMAQRMGNELWGATPGGPSRLFATYAKHAFGLDIDATRCGLDAMEHLLVHHTPHVIRWMPPLLFGALCDFVGVVAYSEFGVDLQWALCEPDPHGLHPPPHFLVPSPKGDVYLPIGLHVLQWCIMPVRGGEAIPPLSAWLLDQFNHDPDAAH